jgi:hypothetical protein
MDGTISKPDATRQDFAWAIAPMSPETFFAEYFEKKHLLIRREDRAYYTDLLSIKDIDRVMTERILDQSELRMVNDGTPVPPENILNADGVVDAVRASKEFMAGGTMVFNALHRSLPKLAAYCRALETVFSCDMQTNIYFTPDNAQGFKTHYDSHDVIVLQCEGTKTWNIYESDLELPLRSQAFDPKTFVAGKLLETIELRPGDMLYVPRGVVHDAIATDTVSLHITSGLMGKRWIELLIEAVAEQGLADPAFRKYLPPGYAGEGFDPTEAFATFRDLLDRVVRNADPARTFGTMAQEFRDKRLPHVPGQFLAALGAEALTPDSIVGARLDLIGRMLPPGEGEDEVSYEIYGTEIAFPAFVAETLGAAVSRPSYRIGNLPGELDDAGKVILVKRLVQEGVVRIIR